ncbi:MAG: IS256 family transposase [Betaproteobacteria bacterium]
MMLPILSLVTEAQVHIEDALGEINRGVLEALLEISALQRAGEKTPGRVSGAVRWYGSQGGRLPLGDRHVRLRRPRYRDASGEVAIPAYECLKRNPKAGMRLRRLVMAGVSTRNYAEVVPPMAETVGISKSAVSRRLVEAAKAAMARLAERKFDELDILAVYIDGIRIAGEMIVVALGLDATGEKHLLGIKPGDTENAQVVKALLVDLAERGVRQDRRRLFIIDGAKALRSAIGSVFGDSALIQRCRTHQVRNVLENIADRSVRDQTRAVMRAAFKASSPKEGRQKLATHAAWLKSEYHDAGASLMEGIDEMFTVNDLGLTPALIRCLATTNIVENPNGTLRRITHRVSRWRDRDMKERWAALAYLEAERRFRKIQGCRDLWILAQALGRNEHRVDRQSKAA